MRPVLRSALLSCACVLGLMALLVATACSPGDPIQSGGAGWSAVYDTIADTVVVRTVSGSVWGAPRALVPEMTIGVLDGEAEYMLGSIRSIAVAENGHVLAMDLRPLALREYDADGNHVRTMGREGEGPGEYKQPDGGLAVLSDGRIVVRDPGNARFTVYGADGEYLDGWPIRGGFNTGRQVARDRDDNIWTMVLVDPSASVFDWVMGLAQYRSDGSVGDTLVEPQWDYEPPTISGQGDGSSSVSPVPFSPEDHWVMSPLGYMVGGLSTTYSIMLFRTDEPALKIESAAEPVAVESGEGSWSRERATRNMVSNYPGWRWNGPDIPDVKPAFRGLYASEEGRIWVWLSGPGTEIDNPDFDPSEADSPRTIWREDQSFDVFEPDGRYLGRVLVPDDFGIYPTPVFRGDTVWGVTADALGVQRIVRYRVAPEPAEGSS